MKVNEKIHASNNHEVYNIKIRSGMIVNKTNIHLVPIK